MIEKYKVEEFLYTYCDKTKRRGDGYICRCPVCGDSKRNPNMRRCNVDYYYAYDEWIYKCYNGGCSKNSGNIQSLYAHVVGVSFKEACNALEEKEYNAEKLLKRLDRKHHFVEEADDEVDTGELDLDIKECYSLKDKVDSIIGKKYLKMLQEFHIERKIPTKYNVMIAHSGKYKNRFIVPVFDGDEMIYFQGRVALAGVRPKYLNPVAKKEFILLNSDKFDVEKPIIVCEGLIDAYSIEGHQGTACIGASISDAYLRNLYSKHPAAKVIIALDNPDTDESGYANYQKIIEKSAYKSRLKYFFMDDDRYKDMNDFRQGVGWDYNILDHVQEKALSYFSAQIKITDVL